MDEKNYLVTGLFLQPFLKMVLSKLVGDC